MAHWQKFFLGTALAIVVSSPLYASAGENQAPAVGEQAAVTAENAVEPAAKMDEAPPAQAECDQAGGLAENSSASVSFFYPFPAANITKEEEGFRPAGVRAESEGGVMLIDGAQYTLQYIEFPRYPALPFSSVQYPMEARFVHKAADGSLAVLSVPIKEGKANVGVEMMLQAAKVDPNDLLPADHALAKIGDTTGCPDRMAEKHYVLTTPVQVSAAQIKKFEELF